MVEPLENLSYCKSCPAFKEELEFWSKFNSSDVPNADKFVNECTLYHDLVDIYGRLYAIFPDFTACDKQSMQKLEAEVLQFNDHATAILEKYELDDLCGDPAIFITGLHNAVDQFNKKYQEIKTINKLAERWIWLDSEVKCRTVQTTDLATLIAKTKKCIDEFTDKSHPLYSQVNELSIKILKAVVRREKDALQQNLKRSVACQSSPLSEPSPHKESLLPKKQEPKLPNFEFKSLKAFLKSKDRESLFEKIQKKLNGLEGEAKERMVHSFQNYFPQIIIDNVELLEKCASFWEDESSPDLTPEEKDRVKKLYLDPAVPSTLSIQLELIERMHDLKFHVRSPCPISRGPMLDAVRTKTLPPERFFFNRKEILQWIFDKKTNPCNRGPLTEDMLEEAQAETMLVNDFRLFEEVFFRNASHQTITLPDLLDDIAKELSPAQSSMLKDRSKNLKEGIQDVFTFNPSEVNGLVHSTERLLDVLNPPGAAKAYRPLISHVCGKMKNLSDLTLTANDPLKEMKYLILFSQIVEGLTTFNLSIERLNQYENVTQSKAIPILLSIYNHPEIFAQPHFSSAQPCINRLINEALHEFMRY